MKRATENLTFFLWGAMGGLLAILVVQAIISGKILRAAVYLAAGAALYWALSGDK